MTTFAEQERAARSANSRRSAERRWRAVEDRIAGDIVKFVGKHPSCTGDDLRSAVRGQGTTIDRVRRRLVDEGRLRRTEGYVVAKRGKR